MTTRKILDKFRDLRVLVAGDVCLDRWCRYDPALADASRETGIPRIGVVGTEVTPGAAGTIANNLAALGAGHVAVLGMVGNDGFGYELRGALAARGISHDLLVEAPGVATFTYTKLINAQTGAEDLPRVDFVYTEPLPVVSRAGVDRPIGESRAQLRRHPDFRSGRNQSGRCRHAGHARGHRTARDRLPGQVDLGGFPFARGTFPPYRGKAESAGSGGSLRACARARGLCGVTPPYASTLPDCDSWRKGCAGG